MKQLYKNLQLRQSSLVEPTVGALEKTKLRIGSVKKKRQIEKRWYMQ